MQIFPARTPDALDLTSQRSRFIGRHAIASVLLLANAADAKSPFDVSILLANQRSLGDANFLLHFAVQTLTVCCTAELLQRTAKPKGHVRSTS